MMYWVFWLSRTWMEGPPAARSRQTSCRMPLPQPLPLPAAIWWAVVEIIASTKMRWREFRPCRDYGRT